jgi:predicted HTH domain antitoxin
MKELTISVPEDILEAVKLPPKVREKEILKELALALYAREILSLGKARSLAKMSRWEFEELLGKRKVIRHYNEQDLEEDIQYASHYK